MAEFKHTAKPDPRLGFNRGMWARYKTVASGANWLLCVWCPRCYGGCTFSEVTSDHDLFKPFRFECKNFCGYVPVEFGDDHPGCGYVDENARLIGPEV